MNQIFSFKRFVWLLKRQWLENSTFYKWGMAIIAVVIPVINWSIFLWRMSNNSSATETGLVFLIFFLLFNASYYFIQTLGSKNKRIFSFSLPVSPLEQVIVAFVYTVVLVPAYVLTIFCINDYLFVLIFNNIHVVSEQMLMFKSFQTPFGTINIFFLQLLYFFSFLPIFALFSFFLGHKGLFFSIVSYISFLVFFSFKKMWELYSTSLLEMIICVLLIEAFCWTLIYYGMKNKEVAR